MSQTTMLSDAEMAATLNRSAHRGGKLTDTGYWYSIDAHPACRTFPLGSRDWSPGDVRRWREEHPAARHAAMEPCDICLYAGCRHQDYTVEAEQRRKEG